MAVGSMASNRGPGIARCHQGWNGGDDKEENDRCYSEASKLR